MVTSTRYNRKQPLVLFAYFGLVCVKPKEKDQQMMMMMMMIAFLPTCLEIDMLVVSSSRLQRRTNYRKDVVQQRCSLA